MKPLTLAAVAISAALALAITTATAALALPDLSLTLTGSAFPLHFVGTLLTVQTEVNNSSGVLLKGEGLLVLSLTSALSSLGTYEADFTKVENSEGSKCHSITGGTDPGGEVLGKGTYHLVYTSLAGSAQGLQLGILYLMANFEIVCGVEEILAKGDTLSSLAAGSSETAELTELGGQLLGGKSGKPELTNYYTAAGTGVAPALLLNAGTGFVQSDTIVVTPLELGKVSKTNMFVITNR